MTATVTTAPSLRVASLRRQLLTLGLDLVAPIVVFYGLRWAGVSTLVALGAGAVIPGMGAAIKVVRTREVDQLAVVVMATMLSSIAVSFISGNARFLLAKDGVLTGVWGAWFLISVRSSRPAAFIFSRPLLEGRKAFTAESWDSLWERVPAFRRIWRTATVMWGLGVSADAVLRVVMAYALPVDVAPALGGLLFPVTFVVLQVITNVYYHRAGLWAVLEAPWIRSGSPTATLAPPLKEVPAMSASTTTIRTATSPATVVTTRAKRQTRALAVIAATVATLIVWAIARPMTDLTVHIGSGSSTQQVGLVSVAVVSLLAGLSAWALLALLERSTTHARTAWTVIAVVVLAVSLSGPLAGAMGTATTAALVSMHLAAAGVLIPVLARTSPVNRPVTRS